MKFLSFFTKLPNHQTFNYNPRYYNPLKERAKEREIRIKNELGINSDHEVEDYRFRIKGSFDKQAYKKRSRSTTSLPNTTLIRLGIILVLVLFLIAYLSWGSVAFYGFLLFLPVYIYLKFKHR